MIKSPWNIKHYSADQQPEWDNFVATSRNGTFLFQRDYMDYHADRFADQSLLCYYKDELHALLPAHLSARQYCSHNGLTYGGFLVDNRMKAQMMLELFNKAMQFIRTEYHAENWIYRPIPHIYHSYPCEEDLYALYRINAQLTERKISTVICPHQAQLFSSVRHQRNVRKAIKKELSIQEDEDFEGFWRMLNENLQQRHHTTPVHTLAEITLLHQRFPQQIRLYTARNDAQTILAGGVLYVTPQTVHVQYIASTQEGRTIGAVDALFEHLIHHIYTEYPYFDFGVSVEQGGRILNEGLIAHKEGFGGRAVMYDTYCIPLIQ